MSYIMRQAYAEVDEILEIIEKDYLDKIPQKLRDFFKSAKDKNYSKKIDLVRPIEEQNFLDETMAIIAFLNLKYWCEDEKERERLIKVYKANENKISEFTSESGY